MQLRYDPRTMVADASTPSDRTGDSASSPSGTSDVLPVRVDRTIRGQVSGPVPWVLSGFGKVWAWDQTVGLVRLTGAEEAGRAVFDVECLTPDGRYLYYELLTTTENARVVYDIVSGEWERSQARHADPLFMGSLPRLSSGQRLDVYRYNKKGIPPYYLNGRYVVVRGTEHIELPIDDHFTRSSDGPAAQFSPSGDHVAISHRHPENMRQTTSVVHIDTQRVTRYDDVGIATCGSWSPSASRLLVRGILDRVPSVVDRTTGSIRSLKDFVLADPAWLYCQPLVSGWLDETRVLISGVFGRRIIVATLDVDTGERIDLLDIPRPPGPDYYGIRFAPTLAQANPSLVGPL